MKRKRKPYRMIKCQEVTLYVFVYVAVFKVIRLSEHYCTCAHYSCISKQVFIPSFCIPYVSVIPTHHITIIYIVVTINFHYICRYNSIIFIALQKIGL